MNQNRARESHSARPSWRKKVWMAGFLLLAVLVYSPWVAPYGRYEPFLLGLPYTLFWWMLLTLVLLCSILLFVVFEWREEDSDGAGD